MGLSTTEAVREEFRRAVRQNLMMHLNHEHDWERFNKIESEAASRIAQENEDWQKNYATRLSDARQIILRENTGHVLEPPKPQDATSPILDREALDRLADQRIRHDHQRRLGVIRQDERGQYEALREHIRSRDRLKGQAVDHFEQSRGKSYSQMRTQFDASSGGRDTDPQHSTQSRSGQSRT